MIRDLIFSPDAFMSNKVGQAKIRREILLVLFVGALSVPGLLYVSLGVLDAQEGAEIRFVVIGQLLRPVLIALLLWVGYSLVFHFGAAHFRGRGAPSRVLKGTAWAMVPIGLGNLAQSIAFYVIFRDADISEYLVGLDARQRMTALMETTMGEPAMIVATLILLGTVLWAGYLMVSVVQHAKHVSRDEAIKVVFVPVALHVAVILWAIVQGEPNAGIVLQLGP